MFATPAPPTPLVLSWARLAAAVGGGRRPDDGSPQAEPGPASVRRAPRATASRVIAVDGLSGSGKTWLAERLARALGAPLLHVDDYVPGWFALEDGLRAVADGLLRPWSQGRAGRVRRYDWDEDRPGTWEQHPAPGVVVVEGCGIGAVERGLVTTLLWVDATPRLRDERLAARADHLGYLPWRGVWATQEQAVLSSARTDERADVVVLAADERRVTVRCPQAAPAAADVHLLPS